MPAILILLLALRNRDESGPFFPLLDTNPPTKTEKFLNWLLKAWLWVAGVVVVLGLLWVVFLIGFAIYTLFT
jgi:hypothetical protein